ncbi:formate dehydrogenase accessory protein FdhE [Betaproteobacteria bacterium SCN1]|jgi:FdhE protein|nr:formate dehydrogenase accessory protein FdhE [Betaproteobacteria bacterium SCN1]
MTSKLLQPGQIEAAAGTIPELRLPPADLFLTRARRLEQLADRMLGLGDYLRFVARLARVQQACADALSAPALPDAECLDQCRAHAMPPLAPGGLPPPAGWQETVRELARGAVDALPESGRTALQRVTAMTDAQLDEVAVRLLEGGDPVDAAAAPVVGAALQVHWSRRARALEPGQVARPAHPTLCPVCGAHPVSSVVRIGGTAEGLRYLHCALCASEWHVVRAKCSNCDNTRGIACYHIEGGDGAIQAEHCPECDSYLKLVRQDKDPLADPVADDLATLALDLLMDEAGHAKSGINWYLVQGRL